MTTNPNVAQHLAELDAQYDAHLAAVRERSSQLADAIADAVDELGGRLEPSVSSGL